MVRWSHRTRESRRRSRLFWRGFWDGFEEMVKLLWKLYRWVAISAFTAEVVLYALCRNHWLGL